MSETAILKVHNRVRPIRAARSISAIDSPSALDLAQGRIRQLEEKLAARDEEAALTERRIEATAEQARAAGFDDGLAAADVREHERTELLAQCVARAEGEIAAALERCEALALAISRQCLDQLFGDPNYRADLVTRLIRHQLDRISPDNVLTVRLARADFPDDLAESRVAEAIGPACLNISSKLASGECTVELKLGELDIGIDQQWFRLREMIDAQVSA